MHNKRRTFAILLLLAGSVVMVAFSHRILPAGIDECQRDVTHQLHAHELPPFHCIGHTEGGAKSGWDHVHPWMDDEWHEQHGFGSP